jgi:tRNA (guanine9-N1)-methyltransferase
VSFFYIYRTTMSDSDENNNGKAEIMANPVDGRLKEDADTNEEEEDKPLSKNQLKKKRRWERAMEVKKRRKQQDKEIKHAKAKAAGRDLEQERRELLQRTADGSGKKRRLEDWHKRKASSLEKSFQVCIDCSFEDQMTTKEINSLSGQIRYCYANNRRNPHPCMLTVTSLAGQTFANLQNVSGFDEWTQRAFRYSDKPLDQVFQERLQDVVYLTSDSETVVQELDNSKIYVIGGIVDRNRLPRTAITKAEQLGVATARLPLDSYLQKMTTTKVLTCNHVFEILLKYREHDNNWEKALLEVLPSRKDVELANAKQGVQLLLDKKSANDTEQANGDESETTSKDAQAAVDVGEETQTKH